MAYQLKTLMTHLISLSEGGMQKRINIYIFLGGCNKVLSTITYIHRCEEVLVSATAGAFFVMRCGCSAPLLPM